MCNDNGFVEVDRWQPHCWVNVQCPDADDVRFMIDTLGVPSDFIDSIADPDERPRVERDGDWKYTILRIPLRTPDGKLPYITVPIGVIVKQEVVLTLCYHYTELIPDFISYTHCKGIKVKDEADFAIRIIYSSTYWYQRYLKEMGDAVSDAEDRLNKSVKNEDLIGLMKMQNTLVYFSTSIRGNDTVLPRIPKVYGEYDTDLLDDVQIELAQAENTVSVYSDILGGMLDSFASIISNNVNDIMKKMTTISLVLMVPTMVASFYGMNVQINHVDNPWSFFIIVGASLLTSAVLYLLLRKTKWV